MKNNIKMLILLVYMLVSQAAFCGTDLSAVNTNTQTELVVMMIKFGKVMFGVLIASAIIYIILLIWNAIIEHNTRDKITDLSLKTPQNTDDAIMFFINKNSLE